MTDIGRKIREALDAEGSPAAEIRAARERLLVRVAARDVRGDDRGWLRRIAAFRRRTLVFFGTTTAIAAAAAVVLVWSRLPISFEVGTSGAPGRLGDVVEATGAQPVALRFSEGSSIILDTGGRVRVLSAEPAGARVLIENGAMDVAIVHRKRQATRWRFEAGPFHVLVTGTKFHVAWNPKDQSFNLDTGEGQVVVSGACLPAPRAVNAGDSLRLGCPAPSLPAAARSSAGARTVAAAAPPPPLAPPALGDGPAAAPASRASRGGGGGGEGWRELIAAGHYAEGLRAAERADFGRTCRTANEHELLALADAARLSGRSARALEALGVLRRRFPRSPAAATAAFALGRIAFERQHDYSAAARWFATYLDELPDGPLMGDAVGRLMEARHRAGRHAAARADAERYLRRFPEGPYAGTARTILAE
jgi:TolA-binding protein